MLFRLISLVFMILLVAAAASRIGIPIAPLVAGLGAGGLAIALAVRPTLENIIGGLTLFADRPVRVGDFCRYGNDVGTVEQIGLRSTRIRTLEQSLVTVPNSEFSQMHLDNFTARRMRLLQTLLHISHGTTPDQMRLLLGQIRELLAANPMVMPDSSHVRFVGYGASSKDIEVFAYLQMRGRAHLPGSPGRTSSQHRGDRPPRRDRLRRPRCNDIGRPRVSSGSFPRWRKRSMLLAG